MRKRIAIIIPYFGRWPAWIHFWMESCRPNAEVDWILFTDCEPPQNTPPNVKIMAISFRDYCGLASEALGIRFEPESPYKLCDLKPALPYIHRNMLESYDFVGFGDVDVIYGRIRTFYDDKTLALYDVLSTHPERVSGHLFIMRNRPDLLRAFREVRGWSEQFLQPDYAGFDETSFCSAFIGRKARLVALLSLKRRRALFREAYTTPVATAQMRWFWKDGRVSNEFYPHREFMYLHFMSWHSRRWLAFQKHVVPGSAAPWERLEKIVKIGWREARDAGFMISPNGIEAIAMPTFGN